jgi:hypothetical protein
MGYAIRMMECSEEDCAKPPLAKGLCRNHYYRLKRNGHTGLQDRSPKPCSVEGCDTVVKSRGMCGRHYQQWKAHGAVQAESVEVPFVEWFWSQVDSSGGPNACHPWTAGGSKGYGYLKCDGEGMRAHRVAFMLTKGPISRRKEIDHTCHDPQSCRGGTNCPHRRCCNPAHLAAKTHLENCAADRTILATLNRERRAMQEACVNGHPWTEENTHITRQGYKHCRACNREKAAEARNLKKRGTESCVNGHPRTEENTYTHNGKRNCRVCNREKVAERRKLAKQAAE